MAETRLTNIITPDIFTAYSFEPWVDKSRFFQSGVIQDSPELTGLLNGGGRDFDSPFWQPLSGNSTVPSETVDETVNPITTAKQIVRRQERNKSYGANALSAIRSGSKPLDRFALDVRDFWTKQYNLNIINAANGVLLDNIANDSSDLLQDDSASTFSDDGVIKAQAKLGESGVSGRDDSEDFVGIAVDPAIYSRMRQDDQIDFVPISGQARPLEFFMGMIVIVDDQMINDSGTPIVYTSIIFKANAFSFGLSSFGYEPTSFDRNELAGMGIDQITIRRVFSIHPLGYKWDEGSVAGISPTDAELGDATNWDRVFDKENTRMVFYRSKA